MARASAWALAALFAATPAAAQVDGPAQLRVTLPEAIRLAETVQPGVVQARGQIRNAEAQQRQANLGAWLPNVNALANGQSLYSEGVGRVDPVTGGVIPGNTSTRSVNLGIQGNIDLFTGLRRLSDVRAGKAAVLAADAGLLDVRFQQRLATTNAFFDALGAAQLVKVREASLRRAEEQLKVSVARLRAGTATRSDSLRSMVTLGNAQLDLVNAKSSLATAEAALGRVIGRAERVAAEDDSTFYATLDTVAVDRLVSEARAQSPSVRNAEAQATAASAQLSSLKSQYLPSLNLAGSYTFNGNSQRDYELFNQRQLSLAFNWNLFNRWTRERNIANQVSTVETADANAANARNQVAASLIGQAAQLEAARTRIAISQTSLDAAQEDLRVQGERYRLGVATILDVLLSQEALNQAEVNVLVARYDYLRAKAQIEALIGRAL